MDVRIPVDTGRSRAAEFYGFVAWTSTAIGFCLYILWALVPDRYIVWAGVHWYPNRYSFIHRVLLDVFGWLTACFSEWALLLPAWSVVLIITTYIVYSALAIAATPSFSEMRAITGELAQHSLSARKTYIFDVDDRAHFPSDGEDNPYFSSTQSPELYDIPIGVVNRVLYHQSVDDEWSCYMVWNRAT